MEEENLNNILSCSICNNVIGSLKVIVEKGLLETHKCFAPFSNIAIDFAHNIAYPEALPCEQQLLTQKPTIDQASLKQRFSSSPKRLAVENTLDLKFAVPKEYKPSETPTSIATIIEEANKCHESSSQVQEYFTDASIKLLINTYIENKEKFLSPMYNKKKVWKCISETLAKHNVSKSGAKCDEKWRNLKKSYEKVFAQRKKTGGEPVFWEYFDSFHDIYAKDPRYEPVAVASSSGICKKRCSSQRSDCDEGNETSTPKKEKKKTIGLDIVEREKKNSNVMKRRWNLEVFQWFKEHFPLQKE